jgi:excisionase family DNA binding protein
MQNFLIQISEQQLRKLISEEMLIALANHKSITPQEITSQPASDKLLTKKEAAEYLKISLPTLSKYIRQGYIKAHTVAGTRMRFKSSDLDKALKGLRNR